MKSHSHAYGAIHKARALTGMLISSKVLEKNCINETTTKVARSRLGGKVPREGKLGLSLYVEFRVDF